MTMNEKKLMGIRITVHRGTNQIGGCVTEYECRGFHLFVDYGEQVLAIMRLPSSWYLIPVKVMELATKEALKNVYDEGLLDIGISDFDEFYELYEPVAHYAPDMIVKPLVDIETFEGKVLCDLVPARYLFPMDVVEQLHKEK